MKKKYVLNFFQFFFIWFSPVFGVFLILTIYLTTITIRTTLHLLASEKSGANFVLFLITLPVLWNFIYIAWREFRFPVIWLSDTGIIAFIIIIIPIKVHVVWENVLCTKETKTLEGALFDYGTSVLIKPSGKTQQWIFKISGGNEIFISSKMSKYDELVDFFTEREESINSSC